MNEIFIPGNVPSLKNSKIKTVKGIFPSKTVRNYLTGLGIKSYSVKKRTFDDVRRKNLFLKAIWEMREDIYLKGEYPVKMYFHFVRDSKRRFNFINAVQIVADLMIAHNVIPGDDMDYFLPFPFAIGGKYYSIDKNKPGVFVYY